MQKGVSDAPAQADDAAAPIQVRGGRGRRRDRMRRDVPYSYGTLLQ